MKAHGFRPKGTHAGPKFQKKDLQEAVVGLRGGVTFGATLDAYTSFKIGGPADVLVEPKQQQPYFKVTAEVTPEGMEKLRAHQIRAGMPAEIMIKTGERTFWNYLFKPLTDRIKGSLTEP